MMKITLSKRISVLTLISLSLMSGCTIAGGRYSDYREDIPTASANGKYEDLIQEITCPSDSQQYGRYTDYGYWHGGSWCGQMGAEGYWVWLKPTWYVWRTKVY